MLNNGRLRSRIELLVKSEHTTSIGSKKVGWKAYKTVFAEVRPLRGNEYLESVALSDKVTYKITIRYDSSLTPSHMVKYQNKYFDIKSVIDINNLHRDIELMCEEHLEHDIEVIN